MKIYILFITIIISLSSCSLVKQMAGANINQEQFDKARQAKVSEVRLKHSRLLLDKMNSNQIVKSNVYLEVNKDLVSKIVKQYNGLSGWIDKSTSYQIVDTKVELNNGSGIATLEMMVNNSDYSGDIYLLMDCLIAFKTNSNDIELEIEPFNISPIVKMGGLLSLTNEIIENLIKINLGQMSKNFPPLKMPVDLKNSYKIAASKTDLKDPINLIIQNPERIINYSMKVKDILVFTDKVQIPISIENIEVK